MPRLSWRLTLIELRSPLVELASNRRCEYDRRYAVLPFRSRFDPRHFGNLHIVTQLGLLEALCMAQRAAGEALQLDLSAAAARQVRDSELDGGVGFRRWLLEQYKRGEMSATAVCTAAYHATRGGCLAVADLSLDPLSTHHAEHLRKAISVRASSSFYWFDMPVWNDNTNSKSLIRFPINLPHEQFAKSLARSRGRGPTLFIWVPKWGQRYGSLGRIRTFLASYPDLFQVE